MKVIFLNMVLLLIFIMPVLADTDQESKTVEYYSAENILKFADNLYDSGDYVRAAGEYQRYIYLSTSENNDSLYYKSIRALVLGGDYRRSLLLLSRFEISFPHSNYLDRINICKAVINYRREDYVRSLELADSADSRNKTLKNLIKGMSYLQLKEPVLAYKAVCLDSSSNKSGRDRPRLYFRKN